jgi:hypothetical protein
MLKTAFGKQAMGRSETSQWFSRFKAGRTSIDDDERSGRPDMGGLFYIAL